MLIGIIAGLTTGALWGLTFVAPRAIQPFTEIDLAIARYAIFGIASLLLMVHPAFRPVRISRQRFFTAVLLGFLGYVSYYVAAAYAVRLAGPAIPPLIIGILPVALALIGNWQDRDVSWRVLAGPLVLISIGLAIVNVATLAHAPDVASRSNILVGAFCAFLALLVWICYAMINARIMRSGDAPGSLPWAGLQGIGSLLATLPLIPASWFYGLSALPSHALSSPEGLRFLGWALLLGIAGSWIATWCWVVASRRLPLALSAQLIIAETIFALIYGFIYERRWPVTAEWLGGGLQITGVVAAVAIYTRAAAARRADSRVQEGPVPADKAALQG
jgi:drug/metabolite transporter (DMT)-like permease